MTTTEEVRSAVKSELHSMLEKDLNPPVEKPSDVNTGFCWMFAENVSERLDNPNDIRILRAGLPLGGNHIWVEHDGVHYDAETVTGTSNWRNFLFWDGRSLPESTEPTEVGQR